MKTAAKIALVGLWLPVFAGGCVIPIGPDDLRRQVSRANGVTLKQEIGVSVDGLTAATAVAIAGVPLPLIHLGWAEFGVYRIVGGENADAPVRDFVPLKLKGWERVVRIRERDSNMHMLVKQSGTGIRSMIMVSRSDDEVIVVRLHGRLHKLLEHVMAHTVAEGGFASIFDALDGESETRTAHVNEAPPDHLEIGNSDKPRLEG